MKESVPMSKRKESQILHMLSERKKKAYCNFNKNSERPVLIENEDNNGMMFGFTDNYVKIKIPYDSAYTNTIQTLSLKEGQGPHL